MIEVIPPTERVCERCGRQDVWDDEADSWVIRVDGNEKRVGNPHCIHEWDINGSYNPFEE